MARLAKSSGSKTPPPAASALTQGQVEWHVLDRDSQSITKIALQPVSLRAPAVNWSRIAGNRAKWEDLPGEVASVQANAIKLLADLGVGETQLRQISRARIVEVRMVWKQEEIDWEYRILPWEFILVNAMKPFLEGASGPIIVRCLIRTGDDGELPVPALRPVKVVLGVLNCPPRSTVRASYEKELDLVGGYFKGCAETDFVEVRGLTRQNSVSRLKEKAGTKVPAIHFLGLEAIGPNPKRSYIWMQDSEGGTGVCEYDEAAKVLATTGKPQPRLVAFSFCHSGPRLAAYTVGHGAHAAIGFQDIVLDDQCQSFFGSFYRVWQGFEWNVLAAFEKALREVASTLQGTGIILWLDRSLLTQLTPAAPATATAPGPLPAVRTKSRRVPAVVPPVIPTSAPPAVVLDPRDFLVVTIAARKSINYAVLHNQQVNGPRAARRTLFDMFCLQRQANAPLSFEVDVEVQLYAGDHIGSWRERVPLKLTTTDLAERIHVPLTSVLARSLRESLRTTIETRISINGVLVDHRCHPVSLLAIEEWLDDGICHIWLPSFVLPRDPAVSSIVQRARRCLCALLDDYSGGFDGYQWGDPVRVNKQVQALWATLSLDWQFGYINPPPSFTAQSQRLRRPSEIIEGTAGTCVDLALLFAACLEYIDIHPIVVLAPGHAYVGWWCHEVNRLSYTQDVASDEPADAAAMPAPQREQTASSTDVERRSSPWTMGKEAHGAIVKAVEEGRLAVVETTGLTRHLAFAEAMREGEKRLRRRLEFECLIDVKIARAFDITPLPMCL